MTKLDDAFDDLEFNVTEEMKDESYLAEQRKVATGITNGTARGKLVRDLTELVRDLTENLRAIDPEIIRNDTLEEVASEMDKLRIGELAAIFSEFVRKMKR